MSVPRPTIQLLRVEFSSFFFGGKVPHVQDWLVILACIPGLRFLGGWEKMSMGERVRP
jgi:hypothetical protein